jgi:hypothetical protein
MPNVKQPRNEFMTDIWSAWIVKLSKPVLLASTSLYTPVKT